jgi:hypothetical protein
MASTVEVTSMPLPEVLVAEFKMAFTASWSVSLLLALVELVVLDSPSSSASDSVLGFKLDRRELIELVLPISVLLYAAARGDDPRKAVLAARERRSRYSPSQLFHRQFSSFLEDKV